MTPEEKRKRAILEKKIAIVQVCLNTAIAIAKSCKQLPKKKAFGTKGRTPKRRVKRKKPFVDIAMAAYQSAVQIEMIKQQPIPLREFESGGYANLEPEYFKP